MTLDVELTTSPFVVGMEIPFYHKRKREYNTQATKL